MKVYFTFGFWVLFISPCLSQWNLSGNSIIGDNSSNAIGYSISINGEGNRVSLVKEGPSGGNQYDYTYVYELQDYQWVQLGNEIQAANMNTTSFVAMKIWFVSMNYNQIVGFNWAKLFFLMRIMITLENPLQ
jgi:hypothetical protein